MFRFWIIVVVLALSPLAHGTYCPLKGKPGIWSIEATYLCSQWNGKHFVRDMRVPSPDHKKVVHVLGDHWTVETAGRTVSSEEGGYVSYVPSELGWAPDSSAFYIVQSDGTSEINGFHVEIFKVEEGIVKQTLDIGRIVGDDFKSRQPCDFPKDTGDYPNVAGVKWIDGSAKLLLTAEKIPHSSCHPMGYFAGYLVSLTDGKIIARYSPKEIAGRWKITIGPRLKEDLKDLTLRERMMSP